MLGYVGCGSGLLGVLLCAISLGSIIKVALDINAKEKADLEKNNGTSGIQHLPALATRLGPLVIFRGALEHATCEDVFKGLAIPKMVINPKGDWIEGENSLDCKEFDGVNAYTCEIETKKICVDESQVGFCRDLTAVATMEYPSCKNEDCPYTWATSPGTKEPTFAIEVIAEHDVWAIPTDICVETTRAADNLQSIFHSDEVKTMRRIFWASIWFLAIGIGAGVASCHAGGGNPAREEKGAELMS